MSNTVELLISVFVLYSVFMWISLIIYTKYFTSTVKNLITVLAKSNKSRNPHKHCKYAIDMIDGIACEHINNKEAFNQVMAALEVIENTLGDDKIGEKQELS